MTARRRTRCHYCRSLYHTDPVTHAVQGCCPTCFRAFTEIHDLERFGELIGTSADYANVVAPRAQRQACLVLRDPLASWFHEFWHDATPEKRLLIGNLLDELHRHSDATH